MSKLRNAWQTFAWNAFRDTQAMEAAITEAEETIARLTRERDAAIERAWKQGWAVGQGDIGEDCERSWLMSRTRAALKGDKP